MHRKLSPAAVELKRLRELREKARVMGNCLDAGIPVYDEEAFKHEYFTVKSELEKERKRMEGYIRLIDEPKLALMARIRFIDGLSAEDAARAFGLGHSAYHNRFTLMMERLDRLMEAKDGASHA
ncbi:MAG: hypothetical protein II920_10060 [Clostridia bacterium]|nr:hypothetical protein [Clostridia bacterium]